jgi:hypothetical protein
MIAAAHMARVHSVCIAECIWNSLNTSGPNRISYLTIAHRIVAVAEQMMQIATTMKLIRATDIQDTSTLKLDYDDDAIVDVDQTSSCFDRYFGFAGHGEYLWYLGRC